MKTDHDSVRTIVAGMAAFAGEHGGDPELVQSVITAAFRVDEGETRDDYRSRGHRLW